MADAPLLKRSLLGADIADFIRDRVLSGQLSREELADLWDVHAFTAGLAAERAAARLTDADLAGLSDLPREFADRLGDAGRLIELNRELNRRINHAGGSRKLLWLLDLVNRHVPRSYYHPDWPPVTLRYNRSVVDALARRDGAAARTITQDHMRKGGELLIELLDDRGFWSAHAKNVEHRRS